MKAITYKEPGKLAFCEAEKPLPPEGWALVRVSHAGICGTDLNILAGTHPRAKAPLVLGHEFSGRVEEAGPGYAAGERVTAYPLLSCGRCRPCQNGNAHVCNTLGLLGIDRNGAMGEYVAVPKENLILLPPQVDDALGALLEPVAVAVHAVREPGFQMGDNALVFGCGTIGLLTALVLRQAGAKFVQIAETDPQRAALAKQMGFAVADPSKTDMRALAGEITKGEGFDWVYDCAGVQAVAGMLLDMVRVKGTVVVVAAYKKPPQLPFIQGMFKEVQMRFVRVYRKQDFQTAVAMVCRDENFAKVTSHILPAEKAQEGFALLTQPGTGAMKVMFTF